MENLMFWREVNEYRQSLLNEARTVIGASGLEQKRFRQHVSALAKTIYAKYMAKGAQLEINVSAVWHIPCVHSLPVFSVSLFFACFPS